MRDANDVITTAVSGHTERLAAIFEVGMPRMYQLLSTHCHYPPAKRLIRAIASVNQEGARLIKADIDAMFADILHDDELGQTSVADLHRESYEAIQAIIEGKPKAEQMKELRDLIATASRKLEELEQPEFSAKAAVAEFRRERAG